ncbi:vitamin K epoxide reductase family protein [Flavobacterium cutihirudinis]|uniref:Vitamin K epoxide reductase family protein n=1 Tax=Flavobacterium cutihirudinis TaxID=1265740 RepID=A0A3D9FWP9_9FLAO|nr:vitamin K epoxide reductase family protein [Flavobacterium cutihirudinis]RED25176.1 vitamin K epoxide reductase family protein [Flavobacterium cutihirudinis]
MLKLVQKFLQINKYSEIKNEFKDLFLSHPNYPSLFAITDSLDLLSIENAAVRVSKEQIVDLPENFLAYFKDELSVVEKFKNYVRITTVKKGMQKIPYEKFLLDWNGVIVAIEPNTTISRENLKIEYNWLKYFLPFVLLTGLSFFYNPYSLFSLIFLITSTFGLVVSVLIVQEKLGFNNSFISKFCNLSSNSSCNSVINFNEGNQNWLFNFSDLPLLFFSSSLIAILIRPLESSIFIGFLSLLAIPIIVSSIWIQKFEIQKWCTMCLAVSFLIFVQSLIWFASDLFTLSFSFENIFPFLFSFIVLMPIWLVIKGHLKNILENENSLKDLKKFKRNYSLLNFLSKKVTYTHGFDDLRGLSFGNRNAVVKLTIILSPSCGHCYKTFKEAFDLVLKFPDKIFLSILFNVNPENADNPYKTVVERLLTINRSTPGKTVEAISDWYIKRMNLKKWLKKWHVENVSMMTIQEINKQYEWCSKNNFNYTPVKIVNEKLFPSEYELNELKCFLNDFTEEKETVLEKIA